jgi:hypothetical protein
MDGCTRKLRIKKSRSIHVGNYQGWVGIELEREFPEAEAPRVTQEIIDEVDVLLKEEERKERDALEDRAYSH